ncbi:hypothetical protein ACHAXN_001183 [Cyclotella atomus]
MEQQGSDNLNVDSGQGAGEEVREGFQELTIGLSMLQGGEEQQRGPSILKKNHLYVDTCATYASTPYPEILTGISQQGSGLIGHGNAGSVLMDQAGSLGAISEVWVNKCKHLAFCRAHQDSQVHTKEGPVMELMSNEAGMPYIDMEKCEERVALCFVQTIRERYEGYTKQEIEAARSAREAQAMMGHPTDREFRNMVRTNMIQNCPITVEAVDHSNKLFGPDLAGVRGRTVREKQAHVHVEYVQIPRSIMERFQHVAIAVDVMFVKGVPFLVSVARGINLITSEFTPLRTAKKLAANIKNILRLYARAGIMVSILSLWTTSLRS